MCLDMMEFEGKDAMIRRISENRNRDQMLADYMELALNLAQEPELKQTIISDLQSLEAGL